MVLELCWLLIEHPIAGSRRTPVTESTRIGSEIQVQAATLAVIQTISNPHIRRDRAGDQSTAGGAGSSGPVTTDWRCSLSTASVREVTCSFW
jgi:hypothetical protein